MGTGHIVREEKITVFLEGSQFVLNMVVVSTERLWAKGTVSHLIFHAFSRKHRVLWD
jgi:hypothetical protein